MKISSILTSLILICMILSCKSNSKKKGDEQANIEPNKSWTRIGPGGGGSTFIPTICIY